jgi:hypothetical protein
LPHRYNPTLFTLSEAAREYRGMSLLEHSQEFLASAGVNVRGLSRDEIATRALMQSRALQIGRESAKIVRGLRKT